MASAAREASTLARALARTAAHGGSELNAKLVEGGGGGSSQFSAAAYPPALWELLQLRRQQRSACPSSPSLRGSRARSAVLPPSLRPPTGQ